MDLISFPELLDTSSLLIFKLSNKIFLHGVADFGSKYLVIGLYDSNRWF